jgi:hypothetical protein
MHRRILIVTTLLALAGSASAVDLKGLKQSLGSGKETAGAGSQGAGLGALGGLPAIGGDTAGNAAGVLEYCVKRKYLSGGAVASVKDKLMSKYGLGDQAKAEQDSGYRSGMQGILQGSDGKSFNLDSVSGKLKDKACDYVLENAGSLV